MTAQIIFLNRPYYPGQEELNRLQKLQDRLNSTRIELLFKTRHYAPGERCLAFQRYHHGFRHRWLIYQGFKKNNSLPLYTPDDIA